MNPRATAARIIDVVLRQRVSLTQALVQQLPQAGAIQSRAMVQELCYGVMRWWPRLELQLKPLLHKPFKAKDTDIYALLLIGLYQMQFMRVPDHAAVSETVAAVSALDKAWARKLVNAVLRGYQRKAQYFDQQFVNNDVYHYAHPDWLLAALSKAWPQDWQAIASANNERPPMTLRVNVLQVRAEAYVNQLQQQGFGVQQQSYCTSALTLQQACEVQQLPGFAEGKVSVQDQAAQLAAGLLDLRAGQRVLDVCAAPGGKTAHILETQPDLGQVVALDVDQQRLQRVHDNLTRLRLEATVLCGEAQQTDTWWDRQAFDRILLDAPCSASGVIRRHPDIKWLRQAQDIETLAAQQRDILEAIWPLLNVGGMLLYATCSILPQENSLQVRDFLLRHPEARQRPIRAQWGRETEVGRQILPGDDNMDGFYYALLERVGDK